MFRVLQRRSILRSCAFQTQRKFFSQHGKNQLGRISSGLSSTPFLIGISAISIGGCGIYLYKTDSMKIMTTARDLINSSDGEVQWHDAIAHSLIHLCSQDAGKAILKRHNWGRTLGNWIKDNPE